MHSEVVSLDLKRRVYEVILFAAVSPQTPKSEHGTGDVRQGGGNPTKPAGERMGDQRLEGCPLLWQAEEATKGSNTSGC